MQSNIRSTSTFASLIRLGRGALLLATVAVSAIGSAFATANYVYHERTSADVTGGAPATCVGTPAYVSVLNPVAADAVTLRFKVENQFFTDRVRVYYTTDGSAPSGTFGVGNVGTLVINGAYDCTFTFAGNTIDMASGVIPAQPTGTVVKYLISAYHSGGGDEIFANSGTFTTSAQATQFTYTVGEAPSIATQPSAQSVCVGATATLTVNANGTAPLSYQWSLGGSEISGATDASLSIPNAQAANAGNYTVVTTNLYGTVTSSMAALTVNPLPTVAVNSETICVGSSATLTATTSAANPAYLWSPGGETTAAITVSPASTTTYSVTVTDGATTCSASASGTVSVNQLPTVAVNSETICVGGSAILTATTSAANPTYLWSPGGETTAAITVSPAATASYLVTVTDGATLCSASASGTVSVRVADVFANANSVTINDAGAATPYPSAINVSGLTAAVCKVTVTLHALAHAFPSDLDLLLVAPNGQSVLLLSDAGNGNPVTGLDLTLDDAAANSLPESGTLASGTFKPTNHGNKVDSFPAPAPGGAYAATLASLSGINPNGTWSLYINDDESIDAGALAGGWSLGITTLTPIADLAVTQTTVPEPLAVGSNLTLTVTVANHGPAAAASVILTDTLPSGVTFLSASSDLGSCSENLGVVTCHLGTLLADSAAHITINLTGASAGASANAATVTSATADLLPANNTSTAPITVLEPVVITVSLANQSVCIGGNIAFTVTATGTAPLTYAWFKDAMLIPTATTASLTLSGAQPTDAGTYTVHVANAASAATSSAVLTVNPLPTVAVNSETICLGAPATLTATTDAANPTYLWTPGGATTASLTVTPGATTTYTVTITDGATLCAASASGTVTVQALTTATALTSVTNLCPGLPVTYTTTAAGEGPFTYLWRLNGSALGETTATLTLAAVTPADAGTYSVEVSGLCNTVTNTATLTLVALPTIASSPASLSRPMGNSASFTVTATAGSVGPLTYQWQTNGVDVPGATAATLTLANLPLALHGTAVRVNVSNCAGTTPSLAALLTVTPITGLTFDFNTPGQFTNQPYALRYNDWLQSSFNTPPTVFETPLGGTGGEPGGGALDLIPNNGTVNASLLIPVSYDFSLPGKTLTATAMVRIKNPTVNSRNTQIGFTTSTNADLDNAAGRVYMSVLLQSTAQPAPTYELRSGTKPTPLNAFLEGTTASGTAAAAGSLTLSNWYRVKATFINNTANTANTYRVTATVENLGFDGLATPTVVATLNNITLTNADIVAARNLYFVVRGQENCGVDLWDNFHANAASGPIAFVQPPQSQTTPQGQRATFRALVDGDGPYTYEWSKNGTPIPGARTWKLVVPPATLADSGAQYAVTVTSPNNTLTSDPATHTVTASPLSVVSAGSIDGTTVGVMFNQPVDPTTAEDAANYTLNGQPAAHARVFRTSLGQQGPEGIYVLLTPASAIAGPFTVVVSAVADLSGGVVSGANSASGTVAGFTGADVNPLVIGPSGENHSFGPGQFHIMGGGNDIFGNADAYRYVYTQRTGDFDVKVKIPHLDVVRGPTKAGFDVRESLSPFSPHVLAAVNPMWPGRNFPEGGARPFYNTATTSWGSNPTYNFSWYPNTWLRFRRAGNTFIRYSSTNGVNWNNDGQVSQIMPATLYFGLAVCSVANNNAARAQFEEYGEFAGYPGANIVISSQPTNFTVAAGSSFTDGLLATVSGGGIPAGAGELTYHWQRNDGSGNYTNLVTGGATNNTIAIGPLFFSDNGAQFRCVLRAPGAVEAMSGTFTATVTDTALPTVSSVNGAVIPSYQQSEVSIAFSELMSQATLTDLANYAVTNAAGQRLNVISATLLHGDPRTVVLKVDGVLGTGNSTVGISNLRDLNNNLLASTTRTYRSFASSLAPVVIEVHQDIGNVTTIAALTASASYVANQPTFITYSNLFGYNVGLAGLTLPNTGAAVENYGVKAYTYFVPPTNGTYKFWMRGDDAMELYMNTNVSNSTDPNGKVLIATLASFVANYTNGTTPSASITNITLVAGQAYYMEFLGKEGTGGDGWSVMWTAPGVNTPPANTVFIPTANLAYPASAAPSTPVIMEIFNGLTGFAVGNGNLPTLTLATNFPKSTYIDEFINLKYIAGIPDALAYQKQFGVQPSLANTRYDNYLGRISTYFVAPSNGLYKFYMRSDDSAQFYMNTNAVGSTNPAGKRLIGRLDAFTSAYTLMGQNINLSVGERYYMEALWRDGTGGDGVSLAVRSQGDSSVPAITAPVESIPASLLEYPYVTRRAGAVDLMAVAPINPTVRDGERLILSAAGVVGAPPYGFIWLRNGQPILLNTFSNAISQPLTVADDQSVYTLIVTNSFSRAERSTIVTVLPDGTAPTILSTVGWRYGDGFTMTYSEPVEELSATFLANYQVSGGLRITGAALDSSRTMVSFRTTPQAAGTTYIVTVNGVRDAASSANLIAANSTGMFSTWSVGGSGFLVELFTNIPNASIADLVGQPKFINNQPDVIYYTNIFGVGAFGVNSGMENYGARITGYFVPTNTGYYRFFVRSDDASQFFMNLNSADSENPAGRSLLIHMPNAGQNINVPNAMSRAVPLNQGQRYFVEALLKEGTGGDYLQVGFRPSDAFGILAANPVDNTVNENSTIAMFGGAGAPGNPDLIQISQSPPNEIFVTENDLVSLRLVAAIPPNVALASSYRWQKWDGASYTNLPGGNGAAVSFYAALGDDLSTVRVLFSAPGRDAVFTTLLHVAPDAQAPFLSAVSSLDGGKIHVCFNERINPPVLADNFNYLVNGGAVGVLAVEPRADGRSASLVLDGPVSGGFTVEAFNMEDFATSVNISVSSVTNGVVQGFNPFDVGAPAGAGGSFSCIPGEIDVIAGGADIWTASDQGHLTLTARTGDFDVHLRVQGLSRGAGDNDLITKAGLTVRESTAAGSRAMNLLLEPPGAGAREFFEAGQRPTTGAATAAWAGGNATGFGPAGLPNGWVRLRRVGDVFSAFRSANGSDWSLVTTNVMALPASVLVGLGTTAHVPVPSASTVLAEFRDIHIPNPPVFVTQPVSAVVALGGAASFTASATNVPDGGPLTFQWLKDGVVLLGETTESLAISGAVAAQSGSYVLRAGNDGGWSFSAAAVLVVSNALPVVAGESLSATQGLALTVSGASLLSNDADPEGASLSILGVNGVCASLASSGFEFGVPPGARIYGNSGVRPAGGVGNGSMLRLTDGIIGQYGAILFDDLGGGAPMAGFTASFKLRISDISAEPADGFSFNFAADLPEPAYTSVEDGVGSGLSLCVDNYRFAPYPAGGTANTSGMKVRYGGVNLGGIQSPTWNSPEFIPVTITLKVGGLLTVTVSGTNLVTDLPVPYVPAAGRFGIYARTGGAFESHTIDDLVIRPTYLTPAGGLVTYDSGTAEVTYTPASGYCGPDSFVYLVSDGQQGGVACATVSLMVREAIEVAPVITACATNRTLAAVAACQAAVPSMTGELVVSENCTYLVVSQSPAAGTLVGLGDTVVTFTVTDSAGLTDTCTATVTVTDTEAPSITACAPPVVLPAGVSCTALVPDFTGMVGATDNCGAVVITQDPAAGTVIPTGVTGVLLIATDASGNTNLCATTVSVVDATAPAIVCPADITLTCTDTNGASASFTATATDNCDANPLVTMSAASGSVFAVGTNVVTVTATDAAGNTNTCSFKVIVNDPVQPTLTITHVGADVLITWPQTCTQYTLEETVDLNEPATWVPATGPITTVGADFQLSVPGTTGNKYYRLKK